MTFKCDQNHTYWIDVFSHSDIEYEHSVWCHKNFGILVILPICLTSPYKKPWEILKIAEQVRVRVLSCAHGINWKKSGANSAFAIFFDAHQICSNKYQRLNFWTRLGSWSLQHRDWALRRTSVFWVRLEVGPILQGERRANYLAKCDSSRDFLTRILDQTRTS